MRYEWDMATPAYIIGHIDIHDRDAYAAYEAGFLDVFARYGGELLAVDDAPELLEGDLPVTRCVIARFADRETALGWYRSEDYQALAAVRWAASDGTITLLDGF